MRRHVVGPALLAALAACGGGGDGGDGGNGAATGIDLPGSGGRRQHQRPVQLRPLGARRVGLHRYLGRGAAERRQRRRRQDLVARRGRRPDAGRLVESARHRHGERRPGLRRRYVAGLQRGARHRTRDSTSTISPTRARPTFLDSVLVATGFTPPPWRRSTAAGTSSPPAESRDPALMIYDITVPVRDQRRGDGADSARCTASTTPYVRDGLAFVFAWNTGVIIYDVGNGIAGGSPTQPTGGQPAAHGRQRRSGGSAGAQRLVVSQSGARTSSATCSSGRKGRA